MFVFLSALTFSLLILKPAFMCDLVQIHNLNKYLKYTLILNSELQTYISGNYQVPSSPTCPKLCSKLPLLQTGPLPVFPVTPSTKSPKPNGERRSRWMSLLIHHPNTSNSLQVSANKGMAYAILNLNQSDFLRTSAKNLTLSLPSISEGSRHWL